MRSRVKISVFFCGLLFLRIKARGRKYVVSVRIRGISLLIEGFFYVIFVGDKFMGLEVL